ncbi:putative acetyl-CoA synthetase [Desulforapulum autotrophicum HRM2]|uniref:Acetyl-CoA synthetase n=1 Tax=Desulforapulum autotrophicum (strain ATCC 43914 / DSM 3382 / VKM B-1955 / HRM2) TaxID=177437 RepID=C0QDM5_DESAH|nr:acetate--CoA ligase family protein [Desulforapulum autotrophicum]ACN15289.1 putative acetyl-CoA synthetase [Desulforapulum autotrophicum HRM2]
MEIIQTALEEGLPALSEHQSKKVLEAFGIPTTRETLVHGCKEAVVTAETMGYPVVLKACAAHLMHKSEKNCVRLNLTGPDQVRDAYDSIMDSIDVEIDGILVQEAIHGQRELIMGMTRDPQFGACIMLGMGGIATEIFKDSVFRVAPFDRGEATDMARELKAAAMLGRFRGQARADMDTICNCLMALAAIALDHPEISEIDINPLIIDPQGKVTAVDALVVLGNR